jgi:hypothetical protein
MGRIGRVRKLADDEVSSGGEAEDSALASKVPKPPKRRSPATLPKVSDDIGSTKGAGAAGVGGGTLIAILASALPDGIGKTILIWLAPTATLTFTALWIWCRKKLVEYFNEKDAEAAFKAARVAIEQALNNPNLTPGQRAEMEAKRVELDKIVVERRMSKAISYARK